MFVIMRNDGKYVAASGSEPAYTSKLQNAWVYPTRENALQHLCPDNEQILAVSSVLERNLESNRPRFN